jgi:hypothetical protein
MQGEIWKRRILRENSLLKYLIFSFHIILFCTIFPAVYQRRNIPNKNMKELKEYFDHSREKN